MFHPITSLITTLTRPITSRQLIILTTPTRTPLRLNRTKKRSRRQCRVQPRHQNTSLLSTLPIRIRRHITPLNRHHLSKTTKTTMRVTRRLNILRRLPNLSRNTGNHTVNRVVIPTIRLTQTQKPHHNQRQGPGHKIPLRRPPHRHKLTHPQKQKRSSRRSPTLRSVPFTNPPRLTRAAKTNRPITRRGPLIYQSRSLTPWPTMGLLLAFTNQLH